MTLTLLLDMDDTLLTNDMDRFLPAYLKKLGMHLSDHVAPETMLNALMAGTRAMIQNKRPDKRLKTVFDDVFYPGIGHPRETLSNQINDFYERVYPALQAVTEARPQAVEFVNWAFKQGYKIAITTNPLFPRTAIEQRLAWAQLPVTNYPFALVSSYETFHFAKPNPAFVAEALAQLEWPDQTAVMVGNSLTEDIQPAQALGIPAFHLCQRAPENGENAGNYDDLKSWLKKMESSPTAEPQSPAAVIALLSSLPAALDTIASNLPRQAWKQRPQKSEWSMGEIFCHLRDVDREVTIPRIARMLNEDMPFLTAEATDVWAEERAYYQEDPGDAFNGFVQARIQLLQILNNLANADWTRHARHAIFGPTSLAELLTFTITHDKNHLRQVGKTIRMLK